MANIAIIGTGYVGLVSGACLSDFGNSVICVDTDRSKIDLLKKGGIPIYEPGLEVVVDRNVKAGRLSFSTDLSNAVKNSNVVFIAVGTPPAEDGSADLSQVLAVADSVADSINSYTVVVNKSTVPVGTGRLVRERITERLKARGCSNEFDVVSNPEFLREGSAVHDFMHPDRVVVGFESDRAKNLIKEVYQPLYINKTPFLETNNETAEMIKYASNAFLAMKITFINEVANLCEKVGANVQDIARGMGMDGRISPKFLHAGPGYGGSCFPKDTRAMADTGRKYGSPMKLVEETVKVNEEQKLRMVGKIKDGLGTLKGKTIAVLGLAFKPNTDDMREAPALTIVEGLVRAGAKVRAFDPVAMTEAKWRLDHLKESILLCQGEYEAMEGADALCIITEWNQFRNLDFDRVKTALNSPVFFDLRNIYNRDSLESAGFKYYGVGQ